MQWKANNELPRSDNKSLVPQTLNVALVDIDHAHPISSAGQEHYQKRVVVFNRRRAKFAHCQTPRASDPVNIAALQGVPARRVHASLNRKPNGIVVASLASGPIRAVATRPAGPPASWSPTALPRRYPAYPGDAKVLSAKVDLKVKDASSLRGSNFLSAALWANCHHLT